MPVLTKINTNSIAEDAITGDKFAGDAYLSNTANQNISGTYSENRLYTSDAYTLSANATVNSHLTLSSIKPTADVVLTAGGAYTLTGTGVLSGGSLLAKERTDLTGMTGELGSAVTGSPNLNLTTGTIGTGVTFNNVVPVFHMRASADVAGSAGSDNKAQLNTIVFETGSYCDTTNYRVTVPRTGYWQINYSMRFTGHQYWTITKLYINGAFTGQGMFLNGGDGGDGESHNSQVSTILKLYANDYIEVWWHPQVNTTMLYSNGDGTHTSYNMCSLSGHFIGAS